MKASASKIASTSPINGILVKKDSCRIFKWSPPTKGLWKLNFDGVLVTILVQLGQVSIIRNSSSNLVKCASFYLGQKTSNQAEREAVIGGLSLTKWDDCNNLFMQGKSINIIKGLQKENSINWKLYGFLEEAVSIYKSFDSISFFHY